MKVGFFTSLRGGAERFAESVARYNGEIEMVAMNCPPTIENVGRLKGCEGLLFSPFKNDGDEFWKKVAEAGVKYVVTCSVGFDHFNIPAMKKYGLKAANVPYYSPNAISEHTVMLLLSLLRNFRTQIKNVEAYNMSLDGLLGKEVRNQVIGIVGAGRIGFTTIKNLSGFGPKKIYANDHHEHDEVKQYAEYASLDEIYEKCDVIIFHCAYHDENYHMVNKEVIAKMKDGAILINSARGKLFDNEAILEGLKSGKLGGVALDVIEGEEILRRPTGENRLEILDELMKQKNFLFTMHTAFYTDEAEKDQAYTTIDDFHEYCVSGECKYELVK